MAQKVQVLLVDDVDGGTADETVTFGLDGASYEIDLSEANAASLRDVLRPWIGSARKVSAKVGRRAARADALSKEELVAMRTWARANGYTVSDRGRVSGEIRAAYDKANS